MEKVGVEHSGRMDVSRAGSRKGRKQDEGGSLKPMKQSGTRSRHEARAAETAQSTWSYCALTAALTRPACYGYQRCRRSADSGWGWGEGDCEGLGGFEARSGVCMMQSKRPGAWPLSRDHRLGRGSGLWRGESRQRADMSSGWDERGRAQRGEAKATRIFRV